MEAKRKHIIYKEEFRRQAVEMVIHNTLGAVATQKIFKREISSSDMSVDGATRQTRVGERNSQQGPIRLIDLDVALVDLLPGRVKFLYFTQSRF